MSVYVVLPSCFLRARIVPMPPLPPQTERATHSCSLQDLGHISKQGVLRSLSCPARGVMIDMGVLNDDPGASADETELDVSGDSADETVQARSTVSDQAVGVRRRISLSSLWPQASASSVTDEADSQRFSPNIFRLGDAERHGSVSQEDSHARGAGDNDPVMAESALPLSPSANTATSPIHNVALDMVFPAARQQILTWHPNRLYFAVTHLLCQRLARERVSKRRKRGKTKEPLRVLKDRSSPGGPTFQTKFSARQRIYGRDFFTRVICVLTGSSVRQVRQGTQHLWEALSNGGKDSWAQLAELFKLEEVQRCGQEFLPASVPRRQKVSDARRTDAQEQDKTTYHGYGVSMVYNTSLGQDDVQVIRVLQSGLTGSDLREALRELPCYTTFIDDCWAHFEKVGKDNGFPLVACGLEHSENGSHPGRVHVHVFTGMDVRGCFFSNNAPMGSISHDKLKWAGLQPGFVRPTVVARRTHSHIHKAVIQAYYYVAGPKTTQLLIRCSASLYTDA